MAEIRWKHGKKKHILDTYARLVEGKTFEHWVWVALERIANGEAEADVMADYGYIAIPAWCGRGGKHVC